MDDPNFERSVVLMLRHDANGAFGLVISRPSPDISAVDESDLDRWVERASPPSVLFEGGPVQRDAVIGLASFAEVAERSWTDPVVADLHLIDLQSDATNALECTALRLFVGYSGWGALQLDGEIASQHWFVVDAESRDAFDGAPHTLWRRVLERDPTHRAWVRDFPDDPNLN